MIASLVSGVGAGIALTKINKSGHAGPLKNTNATKLALSVVVFASVIGIVSSLV